MPRPSSRFELRLHVASLLDRGRGPAGRVCSTLCGGMAVFAIGITPAGAVGLGELDVRSGLGQPLDAAVPLRLADGERVGPRCIAAAPPADDLFALPAVTVGVAESVGPTTTTLRLTTRRPLGEPMYELALEITCPGTPILLRSYTLLLDLPRGAAPANTAVNRPVAEIPTPESRPALREPAPLPAPRRNPSLERAAGPVRPGDEYQVREGDTLSTIAERVQGRLPGSTWNVATLIFAANPDAFIRGNPDLIKLGSVIRIPGAQALAGAAGRAEPPPAQRSAVPRAAAAAAVLPTAPAPAASPTANNPADATPAPAPARASAAAPAEPAGAAPLRLTPQSDPSTLPGATPGTVAAGVAAALEQNRSAAAAARAGAPAGAPPADRRSAAREPVSQPPAPRAQASRAAEPTPTPDRAAVTARASAPASGVSPLLAVGFGMLLGLGLSALMVRSRLLERIAAKMRRPAAPAEGPGIDDTFADTDEWMTPAPAAAAPVAVAVGTPSEDTYVVEVAEVATREPRGAAADPAERTDESAPFEAVGQGGVTGLADVFANDEGNALEPSLDLPEEVFMPVDEDTGGPAWSMPTRGEPAAIERTAPQEALDLHRLASAASDDTRLSQTLKEALSLLERDYEDELTASQVIDREAARRALDQGDDEDTGTFPRRKLTG